MNKHQKQYGTQAALRDRYATKLTKAGWPCADNPYSVRFEEKASRWLWIGIATCCFGTLVGVYTGVVLAIPYETIASAFLVFACISFFPSIMNLVRSHQAWKTDDLLFLDRSIMSDSQLSMLEDLGISVNNRARWVAISPEIAHYILDTESKER